MSELSVPTPQAAMSSFDTPVLAAPSMPCSFKFNPKNNAKLLEIHPHFELFLRPASEPVEEKAVATTHVSSIVQSEPVQTPVVKKQIKETPIVKTRIPPIHQKNFQLSTLQGPKGMHKSIPSRPFLNVQTANIPKKDRPTRVQETSVVEDSKIFVNVQSHDNKTTFEETPEPQDEGPKDEYRQLYEEFCKLIPQKPFARISRIQSQRVYKPRSVQGGRIVPFPHKQTSTRGLKNKQCPLVPQTNSINSNVPDKLVIRQIQKPKPESEPEPVSEPVQVVKRENLPKQRPVPANIPTIPKTNKTPVRKITQKKKTKPRAASHQLLRPPPPRLKLDVGNQYQESLSALQNSSYYHEYDNDGKIPSSRITDVSPEVDPFVVARREAAIIAKQEDERFREQDRQRTLERERLEKLEQERKRYQVRRKVSPPASQISKPARIAPLSNLHKPEQVYHPPRVQPHPAPQERKQDYQETQITQEPKPKPQIPLVSVVIPMYNVQPYITQSIQSVLSQTYSNIEIILVDDASTDDTGHIANQFMVQYPEKISYMRQAKNRGTYVSLNLGFLKAKGDFITILGADDMFAQDKIARQVALLIKNPQCVACFCWFRRYHYKTNKTIHQGKGESTVMIRRQVVDRIGYFDSVRYASDTEYMDRIYAAFGRDKVKTIPKILYQALYRPNSLTTSAGTRLGSSARAGYKTSFKRWHRTAKKLYIAFPPKRRPFPAEAEMF